MIIETELGSWYEIAQTFLWPVFTEDWGLLQQQSQGTE